MRAHLGTARRPASHQGRFDLCNNTHSVEIQNYYESLLGYNYRNACRLPTSTRSVVVDEFTRRFSPTPSISVVISLAQDVRDGIITHTTLCSIFLKFKKKNNIRLNLTTNELIGSVLNQACAGVDARVCVCV